MGSRVRRFEAVAGWDAKGLLTVENALSQKTEDMEPRLGRVSG